MRDVYRKPVDACIECHSFFFLHVNSQAAKVNEGALIRFLPTFYSQPDLRQMRGSTIETHEISQRSPG